MSLAPAAQTVGVGRSHRRNPDYRRRTRQEAFNAFDLANEGRASCRACVILSLSLFNLVIGWTHSCADEDQEEERLAFMLVGLIRKESRRRMNKGRKPFNDWIWKGSSVNLGEFVNHRLGPARRTSERDPPLMRVTSLEVWSDQVQPSVKSKSVVNLKFLLLQVLSGPTCDRNPRKAGKKKAEKSNMDANNANSRERKMMSPHLKNRHTNAEL